MSKVAILSENYAGMKTQAVGFAYRAQLNFQLFDLKPKFPWKLISAPYWPLPIKSIEPVEIGEVDAIISVGSVGGVVNAALRHKKQLAIHIQNPRIALNKFDLIIANPHDYIEAENVLISRTALHHITSTLLKKSKNKWYNRLHDLNKPLVSVLLGGNNGRFKFNLKVAEQIGYQLQNLLKNNSISLAITPSRRTDPIVLQTLKSLLNPYDVFIWNGNGENPYLGLLACADYILVTIDSVSMISEAVATSVPVMIIPLPGNSKRIFSFIQSMIRENRVKIFNNKLENWSVNPIDDTDEIIQKAKLRLGL